MRSWYVAKTKPRLEAATAVVLEQRGVGVYLPKIATWRCSFTSRPVQRLEPLFPGYLFAHLDLATPDWLSVRSAPGIAYFLGAEGTPAVVPDELIAAIRARADARQRAGRQPEFAVGDRVVFVGGPFAGLEAVFDGTLSASGRSRVLIEVLSRAVPTIVHTAFLRRAG